MFEYEVHALAVANDMPQSQLMEAGLCGTVLLPERPSTRQALTALRKAGLISDRLRDKLTVIREGNVLMWIADRWNGEPLYILDSPAVRILQ